MNNRRTKQGDWDYVSMILRELDMATWIKATVHAVGRRDGAWYVTFSTRHV